jgi:hypothetical protein
MQAQGHIPALMGAGGDFAASPHDAAAGGPIWVEEPFPVRLRVRNSAGAPVDVESVLDRLSVRDLYMRLPDPLAIAVDERLPVVVHLWLSPQQLGPWLAIYGTVTSVEPRTDGTYGVAVRFTRHWLLYPSWELP